MKTQLVVGGMLLMTVGCPDLLELLVVRSSGESRWSRVSCAQVRRAFCGMCEFTVGRLSKMAIQSQHNLEVLSVST